MNCVSCLCTVHRCSAFLLYGRFEANILSDPSRSALKLNRFTIAAKMVLISTLQYITMVMFPLVVRYWEFPQL